MNITELSELLDFLDIITRRKEIILTLYPDNILSQSELAEKTGIAPSNLSTYIQDLLKEDIIETNQARNDKGYSVNLVKLKLRTKEILGEASELLVLPEKRPIPDINNFKKLMERLLNPSIQVYSADSIQIISQRYIIPIESGFFTFLKDKFNDEQVRPILKVLIMSARNIVGELSLEDRKNVLTLLGSELMVLIEEGDAALKMESMNLLEELGAYEIPYQELKELYLEQRFRHNGTGIFRSMMLKDHMDKLMDLWISMMDLYESANEAEKRWFDQEFALLR